MVATSVLLFICAFALCVLIGTARFDRWQKKRSTAKYNPRPFLYSQQERQFLGQLVWAVGQYSLIFGKVRLGDVVQVSPGAGRVANKEGFDIIARHHIDFLLCDRKTTQVICAIELYDAGASPKRVLAEARLKDRILKEANIPLARFPLANEYRSAEIQSALKQLFARHGIQWLLPTQTQSAASSQSGTTKWDSNVSMS
mgnify:CR=1 FL=1